MTYPEYHADLQRIHESEVYGIAVFDTAARLTRDSSRRAKWLALKALEEKTLARYLDYMRNTAQSVKDPTGWALKGHAEGAALAVMPWRMAMKLIANATQSFLETFGRLKDNAPAEHLAFFTYVYTHEKAIEAFARKELAGDPSSLKAVESLLAR